jgi:hypothetical protein
MLPQQQATPAPPPEAILMQMVFGKMVSFSIAALAKLKIADHMTDAPRPSADVARDAGVHAPSLHRVLRMLASTGLFAEAPGGLFGLTPVSRLLRSDEPGSLRNMCVMQLDQWQAVSYANMAHTIQTGQDAVTHAYGKPTFELLHDIPESLRTFQLAMTDFSRMSVEAVLPVANFSSLRRLADVGGGHGTVLGRIVEANPSLNGVLYDLPEVTAGASASGSFDKVPGRVTIESGSFFERVPSGCDAYLMKHIVHDWGDDQCRQILRHMRAELAKTAPADGRVYLMEMIAPEGPEPSPAKMLDIEMLVATIGGRERTAGEFGALFRSAGFEFVSITPTQSPISLIEAKIA